MVALSASLALAASGCAAKTSAGSGEQGLSASPVDAKASDGVRRLKKFFTDIYGKKIISGQMDLTWKDSVDMMQKVHDDTGKYPALTGFDFMNYKTGGEGTHQVEEAMDWWQKGAIIAFCWHWRSPDRTREFYTDRTSFRIPYNASKGKLDQKSEEFKKLKADLDKTADQLARLQDAGVPVLWRPLHEASGGWFWWGASGPDAYKALYIYMYEYFTKEKGLHNLLWVWNGQDADWYPGDAYVDIIGTDIYAKNYHSQVAEFNKCYYMSDDPENHPKLVALTENGRIPSPSEMQEDAAWWLYFMTWNDTTAVGTDESNFWEGEANNTAKHKVEVYSSDYVITLDTLPDLRNYPLD